MKMKFICISLLTLFIIFECIGITHAKNEYIPMTCEEKLHLLEPSNPITIYDYELLPDRDMSKFTKEIVPTSLVQKRGSNIPFKVVYRDLNWQRPAYDPAWHSSSWRWSYVPLNIAYQQHTVFSCQGGLSWWYDLSSNLALPGGTGGPSPINEYAFTIKYPYVVRLIVFNFNIASIKYYKNQILVSGQPMRRGITVVDFDSKYLPKSENLLQLGTPDGYEIDYLILYLNNS